LDKESGMAASWSGLGRCGKQSKIRLKKPFLMAEPVSKVPKNQDLCADIDVIVEKITRLDWLVRLH
jgi:hypothetical protein